MKLRQLHINSFGHFADCDLAFPSDGLQVIYGPNEAGKTTLLEFLRGWLFDFPLRTPYDFKSGVEVAGVGTLILSDGRVLELRRRKGNKNKLSIKIDEQESDLDEFGFQRLIDHANQSLFESVFSFGLDQLSRGMESLKHDSLRSALFGGGLGTAVSPEQIQQGLDEQARRIFDANPRKNTSIKGLLAEIKDLTLQIKTKSLRCDDYLRYQSAAAAARARADELHQQLNLTRTEHLRIEKLSRAHIKWAELQNRKSERDPLAVPATLQADARAKYTSLSERLQASRDEIERQTSSIASIERELSSLKLDPGSVSFRAEIRATLELRQSFLEARRDLPKLRLDHVALRGQIEHDLSELRPGWKTDDLASFSVDVATRSEIDRLVEQCRDRINARTELLAKREQLIGHLSQAKADLESLGPSRDVSSLLAILRGESAFEGDRKELERRTDEAAQIERQLVTRLKKLAPPLPDSSLLLPQGAVPRAEVIDHFEVEFAQIHESIRAVMEALQEDDRQLTDLRQAIETTAANDALPTLEERNAARQRRDECWQTIRREFMDPQDPTRNSMDSRLTGDLFEQAMRDADRLADLIYANAEAVARREGLDRQAKSLANRIEQKRQRAGELRSQRAVLQVRWRALWNGCGFEPLEPDVMRRWLADYEGICDVAARRDENTAQMELLRQKLATFETKFRAELDSANGDIGVLLSSAHQAVDDAKDQQRRSKELQRDIRRTEVQLNDCDRELTALEAGEASWQQEWKSILCRLRLPAEWDTELARTVIERLSATRVKLDSLPQEESRLAAMQARLDEFEMSVRPLCESLAPDLLREPPDLAAEKLSDRLDRALESQKQHEHWNRQLLGARDELQQAQERLTRLQGERDALFASADATTENEFLEVVARAEKIRQLDSEIERLMSDLDQIRAGEDREAFERALSGLQPEEMEVRRIELAQQLEIAIRESRDADGAAAVAVSELARLDGSSVAAMLTDDLARKRSQVSTEIDRYVPLVFAKHLLSEAVRRFERENQPEMIRSVSRLMNQMTGGRYTQFDRTTDSAQSILIRRSDGVERKPEQLSTGTREQLYLAIRLAYVLHYCRQNEPLPIVMDDVLVNFDDNRVRQSLMALADVAKTVQVLFFTCHPHMVELARSVIPDLKPIELPAVAPIFST